MLHKYIMYQNSLWLPIPGVTIITEPALDGFYTIPQSQMLVFPFSITHPYDQVRIAAGHTSFYDNQQGSILAWTSDQPAGRSITGDYNSNLAKTNLQGNGFKWLFHLLNNKPYNDNDVNLVYWLNPSQTYFMCFKNLENKNNGLYCNIEYQHR